MEDDNSSPPPHIVMLPLPGMGHLTPFSELAKRLVSLHGFSITFITFSSFSSPAQTSLLSSLPPSITSVSLPQVSVHNVSSDARIETLLSLEAAHSVSAVTSILRDLKSKHPLAAFIVDLFGADLFDAARLLGIPCYLFFPSNCLMLSVMLHLPTLDPTTTCEYRNLSGPLNLPGCVSVPGPDLLHPLQDRSNECYTWMVHHEKKYHEADGILVNSFKAIEPGAVHILRAGMPPVYAVEPMICNKATDEFDETGCVEWLDKQPSGSVLYISLGSGGALTMKQMEELAFGLEMSNQRFLWVVRSPLDEKVVGTKYLDVESKDNQFSFLPPDFIKMTKDVGILVSSWAPQIKVLGHQSTGGFMTHCGWNSTQESVFNGVPMITWPLYAEQHENAVMLVDDIGVALRLKARTDGLVEKEIAMVVRELMEGAGGSRIREKVEELQEAAQKGLMESGASYEALVEVVKEVENILERKVQDLMC